MTEIEAIEELENSIVSYEVQNPNNITCDLTTEVLNMAINSLEKQIPKKPLSSNCCLLCPICKKYVYMILPKTNFCPECGQAIDWSDEE